MFLDYIIRNFNFLVKLLFLCITKACPLVHRDLLKAFESLYQYQGGLISSYTEFFNSVLTQLTLSNYFSRHWHVAILLMLSKKRTLRLCVSAEKLFQDWIQYLGRSSNVFI